MTRLELLVVLVFVGASSYFALWGCFPNCGTTAPTTCATDNDCDAASVCTNGACAAAQCSTTSGLTDRQRCQATSVALGFDPGNPNECSVDSDCVTAGNGDHCVNGAANSFVCVKAEAPGDPSCAQVSGGFIDTSSTDIDGNAVHFCAAGGITCSSAEHGHCVGGSFGG